MNADLSRLANYLNPDKKETCGERDYLRSLPRGQSYRAITGYHPSTGLPGGHRSLFAHYGERVDAEVISPDKTPDLPNFAETFARQSSWEWNFGRAPAFSHLLDERFTRAASSCILTSRKV